jgi:hypothetical protein
MRSIAAIKEANSYALSSRCPFDPEVLTATFAQAYD